MPSGLQLCCAPLYLFQPGSLLGGGLAGHASTLQDRGEDALAAATGALQAHAGRVRRLADDMATVLARFVGAPDAAEALGLAAAWRAERVAARRLAEARALWRQRHGDQA